MSFAKTLESSAQESVPPCEFGIAATLAKERVLPVKLGDDFGYMLALEPGDVQFVGAHLAFAVRACQGRRPVRRATRNLGHVDQSATGIRHPDDDHALVQEGGMKRRDRGFLSAMLRSCRRKHAADFSNQ